MLRISRSSRVALTFLTAALFAALGVPGASFAEPVSSVSLIGHAAPAFTLPNVASGDKISLDSLRQGKKAVVLIYISTNCPVSNAYNDRMTALSNTYQSKGIAVVGINSNVNESVIEVVEHAHRVGLSFTVLKDAGSAIADAYGARHTPEVFVVSAKGIVVYHGDIDDSMDPSGVQSRDLAKALDDILAGKPVATAETKAFGCAIRRPRA